MITDKKLKALWKDFFTKHGFSGIQNSSVVPENDPTVLFTTAGMHPLVPYLLGEKHPAGTKLFDTQRCVRTGDIDDVGDFNHNTFFEMLGNWFLGSCPKEEMIKLSFEFLTSMEYLGIPVEKHSVTVFEGDDVAPRDEVTAKTWLECGIAKDHIFYNPKEDNWWALGSGVGPCGPDTEMFYDSGKPKCSPECRPGCHCGKYNEIWNDVFMQYHVDKAGEKAKLLDRPNIDTGMGVERTVCVLNGAKSSYDVGIFKDVIDFMNQKAEIKNTDETVRSYRILADHLRSAVFLLGDEKLVKPSNIGQGYILRRFIRRSVNHARKIKLDTKFFADIVDLYVDYYSDDYEILSKNKDVIKSELSNEVEKFGKAIDQGYKEFEKVISGIERHKQFAKPGEVVENIISGKAAFRLFDTFGFPLELTEELAKEQGYSVDKAGFDEANKKHQEESRSASAGTFKGGLADSSYETAKLHTATHIMLAGLKKMFGNQVEQRGSNITVERLRFDFNLDHKMTPDEIAELEKFVNDAIERKIDVTSEELTLDEARKAGAHGIFDSKYGEKVKVYTIGDVDKQICGGPHAKNTGDLHHFKIIKEESSSSGIRRIKAILD